MLNKKGFTLVEIILAIALLGIISVSLISIFSSQLVNINRGTEITIDAFDNQGEFEEIIYATKEKIKSNVPLSTIPEWSEETVEVLGQTVSLQKLEYFNLNRNNKVTAVYLSDRLADVEKRQLLTVEDVLINVDSDPNNLVADLTGGPTLTAEFSDNSGQNEFYTNLYRWYRTEPGVDPNFLSFPDDYVTIPVSQGTDSISNLIDNVGANSYVVLTVTPVDIHGYRGNPVMSSNKVYVKGEEWRIGIFPWVDMDNTYTFNSNDYALDADSLKALINAEDPYPNPTDPEEDWDLNNGSLFIPMGVVPGGGLEPGNNPLIISGLEEFKVILDKNINIAKDVTVSNTSDFIMQAGNDTNGGNIYFHPYVKLDSDGDPIISNGVVELLDSGVTLNVNNNVYLETLKGGSIYLYGYTDIYAQNIQLIARGSVQANNSVLHAKENISIDTSQDLQVSIPRLVSLANVDFISDTSNSTIYINSPLSTTFKGGQWSANQRLLIPDGNSILFEKSTDPVQNLGLLDLGNTSQVIFKNSMDEDLENQFEINLDRFSNNQYKLSTENYIRNIAYAGPENNMVFSSSNQWQNLGSGQNNIEFSVSILTGPGQVDDVKFNFDGTDTLEIEGNTSNQRAQTRIKIEVRDKYSNNNILGVGVFNYSIDGSGNLDIDIETGDFNFDETISLYQIEGIEIPVVNGTPTSTITETEEYTGTVTWSPNDSSFSTETLYTATITIEPKAGYTLLGVAEDFFRVDGAISVSNPASSGVVTAEFFIGGQAPGLVLHLDAASLTSSGTVTEWLDESGKDNHAILIGGIDGPSKVNLTGNRKGYVEFNNEALKIDVEGLDLNQDITVIAVLKPNSNGSWFRSILAQYPGRNSISWGLGWMASGQLGFYTRTRSPEVTYQASVNFTNYQEVILAARSTTLITNVRKDVINGNSSLKHTIADKNGGNYIDSTEDLLIGYHNNSGQYGQMNLYEILVFNTVLSDQELDEIYVQLKNKYK